MEGEVVKWNSKGSQYLFIKTRGSLGWTLGIGPWATKGIAYPRAVTRELRPSKPIWFYVPTLMGRNRESSGAIRPVSSRS